MDSSMAVDEVQPEAGPSVTVKIPSLPFSMPPVPNVLLPTLDGALSILDPLVPQMVRDRFQQSAAVPAPECPITKLLNFPDIWLDNILIYFAVEDILALRRTCRDYYLLTKEPIIWKRFLERMNHPLPPLRGPWIYNERNHEFEIEYLTTQAISVDDNWRSDKTKIYNERRLRVDMLTNDLFIMPGGRWMIASHMGSTKLVRPSRVRCYLYLYMLDHPFGPTAVARIETFTRAYNIRAKFCRLKGDHEGIVITYNRRKPRVPQPPKFYDEDLSHDFDHKIDIPGGYDYNIATLYCNLSMLEWLKQPDVDPSHPIYLDCLSMLPNPFREMGMINSPFEFTQTDVHKFADRTWLIAINLPHEIHFVDLLSQDHATVVVAPHQDYPHAVYRIRAFRVYPDSDSMILIRSCQATPGAEEIHFVEWVDLPKQLGIMQLVARTRYTFRPGKRVRNFQISDLGWPNRTPQHPTHPVVRSTFGPPPPISIFIEFAEPKGLQHHAVFATQKWETTNNEGFPGGRWVYKFEHTSYSMAVHMCDPHRPKVLPGSQRAVVCLIDGSDRTSTPRLLGFKRYNTPTWTGERYEPDAAVVPEDPEFPVTRRGDRAPVSRSVFKTIQGGEELAQQLNELGGLRAIAWDETTGRMAVAADKEEYIRIIDFAQGTLPDGKTEEWRMRREWIRKEDDLMRENEVLQDPKRYC